MCPNYSETSPIVEIDVSRAAASSAVICRERRRQQICTGEQAMSAGSKVLVDDSINLLTLLILKSFTFIKDSS